MRNYAVWVAERDLDGTGERVLPFKTGLCNLVWFNTKADLPPECYQRLGMNPEVMGEWVVFSTDGVERAIYPSEQMALTGLRFRGEFAAMGKGGEEQRNE